MDLYLLKLNNEILKNKTSIQKDKGIEKCENCDAINSLIFDYIYFTKICKKCGIINNKIINEISDTKFSGLSDSKSTNPIRYGNPINHLLPKSSMGTCISACGNTKYKSLKRLHKWNQMATDERSLYDVFKKIDILIKDTSLNLKIINETKSYYKILSKKDVIKGFLTRGNIRQSLIAACLFIACKNNKVPMREIEIAKICNITQIDVTKGLKKFNELEKSKNIKINTNINNIHDFINRYGNILNFDENIIKIIHLIYIRSNKINLIHNSNNYSICGGLLYFIADSFNINIKKNDIISIISISEVTLNKIYKIYRSHKKILFLGFDKINFLQNYDLS